MNCKKPNPGKGWAFSVDTAALKRRNLVELQHSEMPMMRVSSGSVFRV